MKPTPTLGEDPAVRDAEAVVAITQLENRYAHAIDSLNWDALRGCFTADCEVDFGASGSWSGREAFVTWAAEFHERLTGTLHQVSSHLAVVSGDTASASCYGQALLLGLPGAAATHIFGRYDDTVVRTPDGWRIARRVYLPLHREPQLREPGRIVGAS